MKAVTLQNISFSYKNRNACFIDLNLEIEAGQSTALLGPNGSGKSTLMALMLGFLKPEHGEVILHGKPIQQYNRRELGKQIGYVSQSIGVSFNYSVLDYVLLGRTSALSFLQVPGNIDRKAAEEMLDLAGISELKDRNILELSAGETQLAAIARCLVQTPSIILLDEPTSHLDPAHTMAVTKLIKKLQQKDITILFSTHDPMMSVNCARYAALLRNGQIKASGRAEDVLTPAHLQTLYNIPFRNIQVDGHQLPLPDGGLWKE